jgi:membrane protein HdeD
MKYSLEIIMNKRSRKAVITISAILLLAGIVGIALPQFMSMAVAWFVGWLMLIAGGIAFYITWLGFRDHWLVWLKPFVLIVVGLLVLFNPVAGAAALGLILAIYFLFDGFAGVGFAMQLRPLRGWGWLMFNGVLSLVLAIVFIAGWPFTTVWLVGLLIGISLFVDGLTLMMLGLAATDR